MAIASGIISKDVTGGKWCFLEIEWDVTSQSGNSSVVLIKPRLRTNGRPINPSATKGCKLVVNGTEYTGTAGINMKPYVTKYLMAARSITIPHNADGTKTLSLSFTLSMNVQLGVKWYYDVTVSGSVELPIIHAASTFTRTGAAQFGQKQTFAITRKNPNYTHTLKYACAGLTGTVGTGLGTSATWTPATATFAPKIPNAQSATCTLTLETYYNGGLVGTKTLTFTLSVPTTADCMPTISAFTLTEAVGGLAAQFGGLKASGVDYGAFLNNKSKIQYAVTAASKYGATIKSYSISIIGQKFAKASGTTAVIAANYAGTHYADVKVTDSRGRSATLRKSLTVIAYAPPQLKKFEVNRCDADGTLRESGTSLHLALNFTVAEAGGQNNPHGYVLEYKLNEAAESAYTALPFDFTGWTYNDVGVYTSPVFETEKTYNIRLKITDYFGTVSKTVTLLSTRPVLDILYSGQGIAFNKMAEVPGLFDNGYQHRFFNGFAGTPIYAGKDFNELLTPNFYQSAVTPANGNFQNCPINNDVAFLLEVLPTGNSGQVVQRLTVCSKQFSRVYERHYYTGSWGDWYVTFDARGKLLWSGVRFMHAGEDQIVKLAEPISMQPHGIVLTFSPYNIETSTAENWGYVHHFVDKYFVANDPEPRGSTFIMNTNSFGSMASKYLHFYDKEIRGNDGNVADGTANGITYNNKRFVLRSVKGI